MGTTHGREHVDQGGIREQIRKRVVEQPCGARGLRVRRAHRGRAAHETEERDANKLGENGAPLWRAVGIFARVEALYHAAAAAVGGRNWTTVGCILVVVGLEHFYNVQCFYKK